MLQDNVAKMTYTYDEHHNVLTAKSAQGLEYKFEYDGFGNNTSVSITSGGVTMESTATYSSDGNRLVSTTDAAGNVTTYSYNADTNVLEWVQYPNGSGTKTTYSYDSMYRLASAAASTGTQNLSASYTYENDLLTKLTTGSTTYNFTYGDFGLRSGISIGSRTLATYDYEARTNRLISLDYGNGDKVQYEYDDLGRVTKESYKGGDTVTYQYDNNGALATIADSATGRKTTYYYATNLQGDVTALLNTSGTAVVTYTYDAWGNHLTTTETAPSALGEANALRYRGYVYDTETGLYYLQSRYYDPEVGRFINADAFAATGQGLLGNNMFAYCLNNPACRVDVGGYISEEAAKKIIEENKDAIIAAGEEFGVDPVIIACCIYTELVENYDWLDVVADYLCYFSTFSKFGDRGLPCNIST